MCSGRNPRGLTGIRKRKQLIIRFGGPETPLLTMELIESQGQNPDGRSWGFSKLSRLVMPEQLLEVVDNKFALVSESGCYCLLFFKRLTYPSLEGSRVTILTISRLIVDHVEASCVQLPPTVMK